MLPFFSCINFSVNGIFYVVPWGEGVHFLHGIFYTLFSENTLASWWCLYFTIEKRKPKKLKREGYNISLGFFRTRSFRQATTQSLPGQLSLENSAAVRVSFIMTIGEFLDWNVVLFVPKVLEAQTF